LLAARVGYLTKTNHAGMKRNRISSPFMRFVIFDSLHCQY